MKEACTYLQLASEPYLRIDERLFRSKLVRKSQEQLLFASEAAGGGGAIGFAAAIAGCDGLLHGTCVCEVLNKPAGELRVERGIAKLRIFNL